MFQSTYFTFNDVSSELMGVAHCFVDNSIFSRPFGINRKIVADEIPNNPIPFDFGYETEVLSGTLCLFSCDEPFTTRRLIEIARWLYRDDYCELISNDNPDVIYYVKFTDQHELFLGAGDEGYINLSFVCNAPWGWSRPYEKIFDLRRNIKPFRFNIDNYNNYGSYNGLEIEVKTTENSNPYIPDVIISNDDYILHENEYNNKPLVTYTDSNGTTRYEKGYMEIPYDVLDVQNDMVFIIKYSDYSIDTFNGITINTKHPEFGTYPQHIDIDIPWEQGYEYTFKVTFDSTGYAKTKLINVYCRNEFSIRNIRNTHPKDALTFKNVYIGGKLIEKYRLVPDETIYINMQKETVESDNTMIDSRLRNCNKKWIRLEYGNNEMEFIGQGVLTVRCQFPVLI